MRFFNLDLHISVIADISDIFRQLGHEVTSWSLSGHSWVFGRQRDQVEVVNERTWRDLNEAMCAAFLRRYRAFLDQFDGFIVTHTPAFSLLYHTLGKPIIVVASTRYEYPFSFDRARWQWLNAALRAGIDHGQVIPVANNRYDAAYAAYFTGRPWQIIPSLGGYTSARYSGRRKEFISFSKYAGFPRPPALLPREEALPERYQWQDLFDYRGIVHIPYNASTMSIFEQYTAGVPLFFPTPEYLMALYRDHWDSGVLSELSYNRIYGAAPGSAIGGALPGLGDPNDYRDETNIAGWIALADYYDSAMMPGISYFDSPEQLHAMLADPALDDCARLMREANAWRRQEIYARWERILSDIVPLPQGAGKYDVSDTRVHTMDQPTPAPAAPPLVSAIVSTYSAERFLRGCLENLEAQTIADRIEIIVVDSGSPQNEGAIVREFQQRYPNIVYIRTEQRESIYAAWNRGIRAARGTYITNANTDDRHRCDALARMAAALDANPEIALVYADSYITHTENETFDAHTRVGSLDWPDFDRQELLRRCCVGPQPMWRKSLHATYGCFDESFVVAGDWEFWLRLAQRETFLHLREYLGLYLLSPGGAEHRNHALVPQENARVYQRYAQRAEDRSPATADPRTTHGGMPPVSCICLTYGRAELLEEAIYAFLQQNYAGPKELIVLNDYAEQQIEFDHPEVRVINLPRRCRTVGEKRNMAVALASHDLLFIWDDDDICLPHRLTLSVARFAPAKGFFKPDNAWLWDHGVLSGQPYGPAPSGLHGTSCWSRRLFDAVGGYGAAGSGEDLIFEERLEQRFPGSTSAYAIQPQEVYYLYRWYGTGSYHLSAFGDYRPGANLGHHEAEMFVTQRASQGTIPHGRIQLVPHWKTDYRRLAASFVSSLVEPQALALHEAAQTGG